MKKLKFNHESAQLVLSGQKNITWRVFDDKDISVNDELLIIDKVDPKSPSTWKNIGIAVVDEVIQKRLQDLTVNDIENFGETSSKEDILKLLQKYNGANVTDDTPVKIILFNFSKSIPEKEGQKTTKDKVEKLTIYTDGGSRGNPGPSASGYVIFNEQNKIIVDKGVYLGVTTNNQAEYTALKLALEEAKSLGAKEISVFADSLLVINQMKGIFKVKNRDLWPIHEAIQQLAAQFKKIEFTQVPREFNKLADAAVNRALDEELRVNSDQNPINSRMI